MLCVIFHRKADIEALDADSYTPLLTAVAYGRKNAMEILLDHQAVVDVIDRDQKSIVFIAAEENYTDILRVRCSTKRRLFKPCCIHMCEQQ